MGNVVISSTSFSSHLQVIEAVDDAQVHGGGAPQLLLHSIQRRMQHELV